MLFVGKFLGRLGDVGLLWVIFSFFYKGDNGRGDLGLGIFLVVFFIKCRSLYILKVLNDFLVVVDV